MLVVRYPICTIDMLEQSQTSKKSCICMVRVSIFASFYDFSIVFWNCSDSVVFFNLHF